MARLPLSKQSAGQTVLYLHRFDADGLLSAYRNLDRFSDRSILAAFLGAVSFVLLSQKFREGDEAYHFAVFYGAVFFLAVYAG